MYTHYTLFWNQSESIWNHTLFNMHVYLQNFNTDEININQSQKFACDGGWSEVKLLFVQSLCQVETLAQEGFQVEGICSSFLLLVKWKYLLIWKYLLRSCWWWRINSRVPRLCSMAAIASAWMRSLSFSSSSSCMVDEESVLGDMPPWDPPMTGLGPSDDRGERSPFSRPSSWSSMSADAWLWELGWLDWKEQWR